MSNGRGLLLLEDWDDLALAGEIDEPPFTPNKPSTGIECPSYTNIGDRVCRSHLYDFGFKAIINGIRKQKVGCYTCGWVGWRIVSIKR